MTRTSIGIILAATCLTACSGTPTRDGAAAPVLAPTSLQADPESFVLITVENPAELLHVRAGSTPRNYDSTGYRASFTARRVVQSIAREYRLTEAAAWPIAQLQVHCAVLRLAPDANREAILARLQNDSRIKLAQPLNDFHTTSEPRESSESGQYNDPYVGLQHGFATMHAAAAQEYAQGAGVLVAIIDTGMDTNHPDLAGRITAEANFVDRDNAQFRRDRHGTEVAGVIAAVANNGQGIVGVAPQTKVAALKACWQLASNQDAARCNSFTIAQALQRAIDLRADVVNLSIAGPTDPLLDALIESGIHRGAVFVGAMPADGRMDRFPVSARGVVAVEASEHLSGATNAVPAPGDEILTLVPQGRYDFATGVSLATAQVSGAAALLLSKDSKLTGDAIQTLLLAHSRNDHSVDICGALAALSRTACANR